MKRASPEPEPEKEEEGESAPLSADQEALVKALAKLLYEEEVREERLKKARNLKR